MFHLTFIAAFLALPAFVPRTLSTPVGGLFLFEPFLIGAAILGFSRRGLVFPRALLFFIAAAAGAVLIGIEKGNSKIPLISDIRPLIDVLLGVLAGANVLRFTTLHLLVRTSKWILWASLFVTLAGSLGGLELTGRSEVASLVGASVGAERLITPATYFALAVACAALAMLATHKVTLRQVLPLALPAIAIIFLSFSRNNILALGIALLWAFLAAGSLGQRVAGVGRLFGLASAGALAVTAAVTLFNIPWLQEQLDGFNERVLGGLSGSGLETDGSALFRVDENAQILPMIAQAPFLGYGFGAAYKAPYGPSDYFTATTAPYYAHQYYYWLLLKGGIVLLAAFVLLVAIPVFKSLRGSKPNLAIAAAVTLAFSVVSTVAPMPNGFPTGLLFGLMLGTAYYFDKEQSDVKDVTGTAHKALPLTDARPNRRTLP
ncbi:O-antigen ligase family protein [Pseudarthrobacter sp. SL88]|uniref:O-antigen ligase family protein n=1 Tax=Pseudarthrobacter sp. SL88 TaxID=2994666 RepID=UPI002273C709|nr:O-antigen ligase family protein [Pseudarthrobacter sp. SL88]MCY1673818.1 O-antigen ligase family protein [Pseudarthrobacter sp. SL88]